MKFPLALLACMLLGFWTWGQESNLGNWLIYLGNVQLNERWNWHNEVQYRNYDAIGDLEQLLLRTGIGYNVSENGNLLLGYGYILSENYVLGGDIKVTVNEHRIFQQFITKQRIGPVYAQHRYRFEQRWIGSDFRTRYRYFLSLNLPISNRDLVDDTFYLSAYNEIFLNGESAIFDRNRLYGGLGYKANDKVRFELGYMNQFFERSGRDQVNVIALVNL